MHFIKTAIICALAALIITPANAQKVNVLTQHYNKQRTGLNNQETILNTRNVNPKQFGKLFTRPADDQIYAQPLVVCGVNFPTKGKHDVVYIATEHNSVYCYDADNPADNTPLWEVNLGPSCPYTDFYKTEWTDMNDEVGITSTPVIDLNSKTIYVEAKTKENGKYFQRLHALDMLTGAERPHSPMTITATVKGKGLDSVNGVVTFNPYTQLQRPGLLLTGGIVYMGFGSHADMEPFHGWLLGYDAKTLQQVFLWNTTPDGSEGAIWQSGQGPALDDKGNIYVCLGNGDSDIQNGGRDYGDCIVRINVKNKAHPIADWFLPHNFDYMNQNDADFGSGGPMLLPGTDYAVTGSKADVVYVVNRDNLGHYHADADTQIVQSIPGDAGNIHGTPVTWLNAKNERIIYVWSEDDYLRSYKLKGGKFVPFYVGKTMLPKGMPGGFMSVSSDGTKAGTGIVWASHPYDANANWDTVPGLFQAFDADNPTKELWNDRMDLKRDDSGLFAKFNPPTVVNGKVYLATFSHKLMVYGLLPTAKAAAH